VSLFSPRFTDFLVYEVDLDSNVVHVKSLEMPDSSKKPKAAEGTDGSPLAPTTDTPTDDSSVSVENSEPVPIGVAESDVLLEPAVTEAVSAPAQSMDVDVPAAEATDADEPWPARFSAALSPYLSEEAVVKLKDMFLEGSEPPFVSDSGWSARGTVEGSESSAPPTEETVPEARGRGRGRGRGNRGARGGRGGRGGGRPEARPDHRKVLSDVRTSLSRVYEDNAHARVLNH
jgi:tRNA pseudouridine13 synthase